MDLTLTPVIEYSCKVCVNFVQDFDENQLKDSCSDRNDDVYNAEPVFNAREKMVEKATEDKTIDGHSKNDSNDNGSLCSKRTGVFN